MDLERRKKKYRWRNILGSSEGTTMVSVLVAFTILMIVIAMLHTATVTSMNMMAKARKNVQESEQVVEAFYKEFNGTAKSDTSGGPIAASRIQGGSFTVSGTLGNQEVIVDGKSKTFYYYK